MAEDIRINLSLPAVASDLIDRLCAERHVTRPTLIRQALGILQVVHDAALEGHYVGTTRDRESLETVIVVPV